MHSSRMRTARSRSRLLGDGDVCLSACWDTHLPWVWTYRPPQPDPSTSPMGVGLENPCQTPQLFPACGPGDLQDMLGYPPPPPAVDRILDTCFRKFYLASTLLWAIITPKHHMSDLEDLRPAVIFVLNVWT